MTRIDHVLENRAEVAICEVKAFVRSSVLNRNCNLIQTLYDMVYVCCVVGCTNRRVKNGLITFHQIPAVVTNRGEEAFTLSSRRRVLWLAKINRKGWTPSEYTRICSVHFVKGYFR